MSLRCNWHCPSDSHLNRLHLDTPRTRHGSCRVTRLVVMVTSPCDSGTIEQRVGIVIPVFNTGGLVLKAARSAHVALGSRGSIVVVDDGSTNSATRTALDELRREGFTVHRQPNGGVSAARNSGIALLSTPYVIALDSDDEVLPWAPRRMADVMDTDDTVAIVTGAAYEECGGVETLQPAPEETVTRESMRDYSLLATASLFRRSAWEMARGFPEGLSIGEDWVFWMRILRLGGVVKILDEPTVRRHLGDHQVTAGRIDVRQSTRAKALVRSENSDLYTGEEVSLIEQLNAAETQLAYYRHSYRHVDRAKRTFKRWIRR